MSDERIEELWTMVRPIYDKKGRVKLHIFPSRDIEDRMKDPQYAQHADLWALLARAKQSFEDTQVPPKVRFSKSDEYVLD